jgi:hypothetical protein
LPGVPFASYLAPLPAAARLGLRDRVCVCVCLTRVAAPQLPASARVLDLSLNRKASLLLVTCADQRLRLFELGPRRALAPEATPSPSRLVEALASKVGWGPTCAACRVMKHACAQDHAGATSCMPHEWAAGAGHCGDWEGLRACSARLAS